MKTILVTAYAVNPYKGSEDAMGWQMLLQAARSHRIIAVTRKNNRAAIERCIAEQPRIAEAARNLEFLYFDWPRWTIRWKKGPLLSMIYYYGWQLTLALWLRRRRLRADAVHNLNFHNDWSPTFLWMLGRPLVWGQVGHHPKTPREYLLPVYGLKAYLKDRLLWVIKNLSWRFDPFLHIAKRKARQIICMNSEVPEKMRLKGNYLIHPSVAAHRRERRSGEKRGFEVISVGRFVPLKGFDLTIRSFAWFYHSLPAHAREGVTLKLVGSGPSQPMLERLAAAEDVREAVEFVNWMPHSEVMALYDHASVFLFPSHEGAGMVVPEAMSAGLPVVCLKNCGPGEAIHPASRLAVPYGSYAETVAQLSQKLEMLYSDPACYRQESAWSSERFEQRFHWDRRGEMLEQVYKAACTNNETKP